MPTIVAILTFVSKILQSYCPLTGTQSSRYWKITITQQMVSFVLYYMSVNIGKLSTEFAAWHRCNTFLNAQMS